MNVEVGCRFGGSKEDWATLSAMVGTTSGGLEMDGMIRHVPQFVRRERSDPFDHPLADEIRNLRVCPVGYALACHAGFDPTAILLLEQTRCLATVETPFWYEPIDMTIDDTGYDVCGPAGPGMLWHPDPMTDEATLTIMPSLTGFAHTILSLLPGRLRGGRLADVVSHPVLDPLDLRIRQLRQGNDPMGRGERWTLWFENAPGQVTLAEAAASYARSFQ